VSYEVSYYFVLVRLHFRIYFTLQFCGGATYFTFKLPLLIVP
jgi:hypothetical protein